MPTVKPITTTNAASVPERELSIIPGQRRREAGMSAPVVRFITSAIPAEQLKRAAMRRPLNMIFVRVVIKSTVVHGTPTVRQEENMSGTDTITLCVQDVRRLMNINGALCIAETRRNCSVRINEEEKYV